MAWNGNAWIEQHTIRHTGVVRSVAISADGNRVVTGSQDGTAKIVAWNGNAWIEQHTIQCNSWVWSVAISADGNKVVTGGHDNTAKIVAWNGNAWIEQYTFQCNRWVASVAISADGNRVVTGGHDNTARIVGLISRSLPGLSDFNALLFEHLLLWAKRSGQKISNRGWVRDMRNHILWEEAETNTAEELQKLIRETMQ